MMWLAAKSMMILFSSCLFSAEFLVLVGGSFNQLGRIVLFASVSGFAIYIWRRCAFLHMSAQTAKTLGGDEAPLVCLKTEETGQMRT